jgi:hypothetical protein
MTRRSDQDRRSAGLPWISRKPCDCAKNSWRRSKCRNVRRIASVRRFLRENAHRGMHESTAGAKSAGGAIAIVARRRAITIIGARMDAMKRTGNARLRLICAYYERGA